jgi:hypothetical protein
VRIHIEVVIEGRAGRQRISTVERIVEPSACDGIGLSLEEVKGLIGQLQTIVSAEHARETVAANSSCGLCGRALPCKSWASIVYRTAFGKLRLSSPRLYSQCRCGARAYGSDSFNPLALVLSERTHPELLYLQTRWASSLSYERAARLLRDILPLDAAPSSSSIKAQVRKAGQAMARAEQERSKDFFDTQPLVFPDRPAEQASHVLELDAAYVRAVADKCDDRSSFGIITGRLIKPDGPGAWHAYISDQTPSPLSRLHHFLHLQDVALHTSLAIISDGGEDVVYPTYLPWRPVQRILDWFHISMRFEHVLQRLRGLRKSEPRTAAALLKRVESAKWRLWHGRATGSLDHLKAALSHCSGPLYDRINELIAYLTRNRNRLVNYGVRYRQGLPISTSTAESAVESVVGDRFRKNRKMRWTLAGANALLHIRVADLNGQLVSALRERHWVRQKVAANDTWAYSWAP